MRSRMRGETMRAGTLTRAMCVAAAALALASGGSPAWSQEKVAAQATLPADVVAAWKQAGAKVGWMRVHPWGFLGFVSEEDGEAGGLPAFRFRAYEEGMLSKLPDPGAPFGLDLSDTHVTDKGLKELAGLKHLQTLRLFSTHVTDKGLKELAGLKGLQTLDLGGTDVTDAGLGS